MTQERRRFVRFQARLPVQYTVEPQSKPVQTFSKDLGGGGVCFFAQVPVAAGTRVQAALSLPGRESPIPFTAEVICSEQQEFKAKGQHQRVVEVDVRFVEIAPHDQADIMHYVMASLQSPHANKSGTATDFG